MFAVCLTDSSQEVSFQKQMRGYVLPNRILFSFLEIKKIEAAL